MNPIYQYTRRLLLLMAGFLCYNGAAMAERIPQHGWRLEGEYLTTIEGEAHTPHTPWAKPYAGGSVNILGIINGAASWDALELKQRLDCEMDALPAEKWYYLGAYYWLNLWVEGVSSAERKAKLSQWLDEPRDVLLMANFNFQTLDPANRVKILDQVRSGAGLVIVYPQDVDPRLLAQPLAGAGDEIARGLPFAGLDFYRDIFMNRRDLYDVNDIPSQLVRGYEFGRGRIVQIDYGTLTSVFDSVPGTLVPDEPYTETLPVQYDYHQALIIRAVHWAAGLSPRLAWAEPLPDGLELTPADFPREVTAAYSWDGRSKGALEWTYRIRNRWNEVEHEAKLDQKSLAQKDELRITLPPLSGGTHYVDLIATGDEGVENWGSFAVRVRADVRVDRIERGQAYHEGVAETTGTVHFSAPVPDSGDWVAAIVLQDCYNRAFSRAEFPLAAAQTSVDYALPLGQHIAWGARLRVQLLKDGAVQDQEEAEIAIRQPLRGKFPCAMWGSLSGYGTRAGNDLMRNFGFTSVLQGGPTAGWRDDLGFMTFGPGRGAVIHSLGDELSVQIPGQPRFADYVSKRYASIGDLNSAWGTDFENWEKVVPGIVAPATDARRFVQFHDIWSCGEAAYADSHRNNRIAIEKTNPLGVVGPEGSQMGDPDLTLAGVTFWGPYFNERDNLLVTAVADKSILRGNWFGGYVADRLKVTRLNYILWRSILGGNNLVEFFAADGPEGFISRSLKVNPHMERFRPSWDEIRFGLGQLLEAADPAGRPVALYHSQASEHAGKLGPATEDTLKVHGAFLDALGDAGYSPLYVTSAQALAGKLNEGEVKVLCLLHAFALSDEEIAAIASFVEKGGIVVADIPPAWFDGNCAIRPVRAMDEYFGIEPVAPDPDLTHREALALAITDVETRLGKWSLRGVDPAIRATAGDAQGKNNADAPVVIVREQGEGKSILLNMTPWDDPDSAHDSAEFLKSLFTAMEVPPPFQYEFKNDLKTYGVKTFTHQYGAASIHSVLPPEETPADIPTIITMKWAEAAYTYDLRNREYLGKHDTIEREVPRSSPLVVARLPYKLARVEIGIEGEAGAGKTVRVTATAYDDADVAHEEHLFQLRVIGPDGSERPYYGGVLGTLREGKTLSIPFALNDPAGEWRIRATEVISGVTAEHALTLAN